MRVTEPESEKLLYLDVKENCLAEFAASARSVFNQPLTLATIPQKTSNHSASKFEAPTRKLGFHHADVAGDVDKCILSCFTAHRSVPFLTNHFRISDVNTSYIQGPNMAEAGFRVRVDDELRKEFIEACKSEDLTASQVVRAYMRAYIQLHGSNKPSGPGRRVKSRAGSSAVVGN